MKTITVKDNTHNDLWLFKIRCKAKNLDTVIQMMIEYYKENEDANRA